MGEPGYFALDTFLAVVLESSSEHEASDRVELSAPGVVGPVGRTVDDDMLLYPSEMSSPCTTLLMWACIMSFVARSVASRAASAAISACDCFSHIEAYRPFMARSSPCVPLSTMEPAWRTRIWSAWVMVESRWL